MSRKMFYWWLWYFIVLGTLIVTLAGCTSAPKSHIYYPPTQAELDQRVADESTMQYLQTLMFIGLGARK